MNWEDLADEPLNALDVGKFSDSELLANAEDGSKLDNSLDADEVEKSVEESGPPVEDSLQTLANEESVAAEDALPGIEDEEN